DQIGRAGSPLHAAASTEGEPYQGSQRLFKKRPRLFCLRTKTQHAAETAHTADGNTVGRRHSDRRRMAVRAEMGWFSLCGISRWRQNFLAIKERSAAGPLFSRCRWQCGETATTTVRSRR